MLRLSHWAVGITQGKTILFSAFEDGGEMWIGTGPRVFRQTVTFPEAFMSPPVVHISLGMWDIAGDSNQRVDISADNVTNSDFEIVFRTWGDTHVARIRADWMAIGPVAHSDDWSV